MWFDFWHVQTFKPTPHLPVHSKSNKQTWTSTSVTPFQETHFICGETRSLVQIIFDYSTKPTNSLSHLPLHRWHVPISGETFLVSCDTHLVSSGTNPSRIWFSGCLLNPVCDICVSICFLSCWKNGCGGWFLLGR